MDKLTPKQCSALFSAQRKYKVSSEFLKYNIAKIKKFIWYAETPRMIIKRFLMRRGGRKRHIIIKYNFLRRVLFDESQRKTIRERKRNIKLWSMRNLNYLRQKYGVQEYVESVYERGKNETDCIIDNTEDVSKQMKEQLEILKTGKRTVQLIDGVIKSSENNIGNNVIDPMDGRKECTKESSISDNALECLENSIKLNGIAECKDNDVPSKDNFVEKDSSLIRKSIESISCTNLNSIMNVAGMGEKVTSEQQIVESKLTGSNEYDNKEVSIENNTSKEILESDISNKSLDKSIHPESKDSNSDKLTEDLTDSVYNEEIEENENNCSHESETISENSPANNSNATVSVSSSISKSMEQDKNDEEQLNSVNESTVNSIASIENSVMDNNDIGDSKNKLNEQPILLDSLVNEASVKEKQTLSVLNKTVSEFTPPIQMTEPVTLASLSAPATQTQNESLAEKLSTTSTPEAEMIMLKKPCCSNFLDMLINKVGKSTVPSVTPSKTQNLDDNQNFTMPDAIKKSTGSGEHPEPSIDSADEFLGFEEAERLPGMLKTPVVPNHSKSTEMNSAFVSESLNEYMRKNLPEISEKCNIKTEPGTSIRQLRHCNNGLVTPDAIPPHLDMPAVPESLQRLRTVAERRLYLHRSSKNHKLSIINNEATIYRELQRKMQMRHHKKTITQQLFQSPSSQQPYTRNGWKAASFLVTEYDKYYYQTMEVISGDEVEVIKLPGVRGNNANGTKLTYRNRQLNNHVVTNCDEDCLDMLVWRNFRIIKSQSSKTKKLNPPTLRTLLKPCPLSQKPFQKPIDEDAAAMLLAGGSMAVVRMPTVDIEVFPAVGKPLDEIAQRYLQYILPHHDISREWAEFSVSTLQNSNDIIKSESYTGKKNEKQQSRRKSFIFAIPYANDRTHILVRRVVDRSEQLDESFKLDEDDASFMDLSFSTNINKDDPIITECATIVNELINSVAISCSENSFIKSESDSNDKISNEKHELNSNSNANAPRKKIKSKTSRLISELKRLNATVIDAATTEKKKDKPCPKEFCALGCVCKSLAADYPIRQHCGKAKCMFECNCKNGNASRIMRLETDGHSITTEDAYMLRRKATERLSRMEKDFTSTVVLTGSETLLINESQYDKKRRCTKAPKRYDNYIDTEDEVAATTSKTRSKTKPSTSLVTFDSTSDSSYLSEIASELKEPVYVTDAIVEKLKHCQVTLTRFEDTKNMTYWCMVHELYKCFCGGHALEGKPIIVEKEEKSLKSANKSASVAVKEEPKSKYKYKYETVEEPREKTRMTRVSNRAKHYNENEHEDDDDDTDQSEYHSEVSVCDAISEESSQDSLSNKARRRTISSQKSMRSNTGSSIDSKSSVSKLEDYINSNPNSCRRVVSLPKKLYLERNRRRVHKVLEFKKKTETAKTDAILSERILRSIYYNRQLNDKAKAKMQRSVALKRLAGEVIELSDEETKSSSSSSTKKTASKRIKLEKVTATTTSSTASTTPTKAKSIQPKSENTSDDDSKEDELLRPFRSIAAPIDMLAPGSSPVRSYRKGYKRTKEAGKDETVEGATTPKTSPVKKLPSPTKRESDVDMSPDTNDDDQQQTEEQQMQQNDISIPKISECFSLNENASPNPSANLMNQNFNLDPTDDDQSPSGNMNISADGSDLRIGDVSVSNEQFKDFYNGVIMHMNNLVSKKMQDIDMALRRESKLIPPPNEEILCIVKWSNFLDAFKDGFVFIWVVKMKSVSFLAATTTNVMPVIIGAVGVVNLAAFDTTNKLPLLSRMLLNGFSNEKTQCLAIVMQGRAKYWRIKGFLRPDESSVCVKPTPDSHPTLTRKINLLCSLLIKQRVRDYHNRLQQRLGQQMQQHGIVRNPTNTPQLGPFVNVQQQMQASSIANKKITAEKMMMANAQLHQSGSASATATATGIASASTCLPSLTPIAPKSQVASDIIPIMASSRLSQPSMQTIENGQLTSADSSKMNLKSLRDLNGQNEYSSMESNVAIRRVTPDDIDDIEQPEQLGFNHRWLVLDLYNDFSHIFVPAFGDLVSLDRIHRVMAFCTQKKKIVKLQFFQNAPFDAYVTPNSKRKIYFGPLQYNTRPPILILLQSVDGVMMLREVYQQKHNIIVNPLERTTAFWILQRDGRLHFEFDDDGNPSDEKSNQKNTMDSEEDDDDDCILIEDNSDERRCSLSSDTSQERINFTIQTSSDNNQLQLTQNLVSNAVGSSMPPLALSGQTGFVPIFNIPPSAVITNVTPAPQDMPYGSTIFISNKPNSIASNPKPLSTSTITSTSASASILTSPSTPTPTSTSAPTSIPTPPLVPMTKQRKMYKMRVSDPSKPMCIPKSNIVNCLVSSTVSPTVISAPLVSTSIVSKTIPTSSVTPPSAAQIRLGNLGKNKVRTPMVGSISMLRFNHPTSMNSVATAKIMNNARLPLGGTSLLSPAIKRQNAQNSILNSDSDPMGPAAKYRRMSLLKSINSDKVIAAKALESQLKDTKQAGQPQIGQTNSKDNGMTKSSSVENKNETIITSTAATTTTTTTSTATTTTSTTTELSNSKGITTATITTSAITTAASSSTTTTTTIGCTIITKVNEAGTPLATRMQTSHQDTTSNPSNASIDAITSSNSNILKDTNDPSSPASLIITSKITKNKINNNQNNNENGNITTTSKLSSLLGVSSSSTAVTGSTTTSTASGIHPEAVKRTSSGIMKTVVPSGMVKHIQSDRNASKLSMSSLGMAMKARERAIAARTLYANTKSQFPNTKCLNINNRSYLVKISDGDDVVESSAANLQTATSSTTTATGSLAKANAVSSLLSKLTQKDEMSNNLSKVNLIKRSSMPNSLVGPLKTVTVVPTTKLLTTPIAESKRLPTVSSGSTKLNALQKVPKVSVSFPLTPVAVNPRKKPIIATKRVSLPVLNPTPATAILPTLNSLPRLVSKNVKLPLNKEPSTITKTTVDKPSENKMINSKNLSSTESNVTAGATSSGLTSTSNSPTPSTSLTTSTVITTASTTTATLAAPSKPMPASTVIPNRPKTGLDPAMIKLAVPGFFCTQWLALPRFAAKRIGNDFLIKTSTAKGYLLRGEKNVNEYLNEYLMKRDKRFKNKLPAEWKFVLQSNLNNQMNKLAMDSNEKAKATSSMNQSKMHQNVITRKSDAQNAGKSLISKEDESGPDGLPSLSMNDDSDDSSSLSSSDEMVPI